MLRAISGWGVCTDLYLYENSQNRLWRYCLLNPRVALHRTCDVGGSKIGYGHCCAYRTSPLYAKLIASYSIPAMLSGVAGYIITP